MHVVEVHYFNPCITTILSEQVGEAAPRWMAKEASVCTGRAWTGSGMWGWVE